MKLKVEHIVLGILVLALLVIVGAKVYDVLNEDQRFEGSRFFYPEGSSVATSGRLTVGVDTRILASSTSFRTSAQVCNPDGSVGIGLSFDNDIVGTYPYIIDAGECFQIDRTNGLYQGSVRASTTDESDIHVLVNEFGI